MNEILLTPRKAAQFLGVHQDTLKRWEKSGKLTAIRTAGGHRRYPIPQLNQAMGEEMKQFCDPTITRNADGTVTVAGVKPNHHVLISPQLWADSEDRLKNEVFAPYRLVFTGVQAFGECQCNLEFWIASV